MPKTRIVITGIGVLAANGISKDAFWNSIFSGQSGIKPITLFDVSGHKIKLAGQINDFKPEDILGPKGLRTLDRSTKLLSCASKFALDDAKLVITEDNCSNIGFACGNTLGSVYSISEFDKEAIIDGPQYVNPAHFPNTVINSPSGQVSIRFNIKGFNATISTGFCASLDALGYALDFIKSGRIKTVLASTVEEFCLQTYLGFYRTGFLAAKEEICCPFDKRRNGITIGESSSCIVVETLEQALLRKAVIYAEVLGFGRGFDAYRMNKYSQAGRGLSLAINSCLDDAALKPEDIDYICAGANSHPDADLTEGKAINEIFSQSRKPYVSSIKAVTGECFSASGLLQLIASVGAMNKGIIPYTLNLREPDERIKLNYVMGSFKKAKVERVLINNMGPSGCNSSVVIGKYKE
ncbi:MAG: beta-ketoacyl-[acyl-carrier-protein] synthase family protein [Candidatus Omnitrophica bacterium]|jgi:3-oxoacyl-[acyl-carrier-protein] synthase II|nr:beta-ketoacyl-[acyl-carrier-protein] synthase family protein [Candidatus Omnitrophota bacterium]